MKHWQARPGGSPIVGATIWLLTRSLARPLHLLLLFFTATTHASGSGAKERPCTFRTKRYFGLDKDGKVETAEGRLVDGEKKKKAGSRAFFLTLARVFPVFERTVHWVRAICTHAVYSVDLCHVDLPNEVESTKVRTCRKLRRKFFWKLFFVPSWKEKNIIIKIKER